MAAVIGNDGNNWLAGTGNADVIKGYGGNDTLKGGGGADRLDGGTGIDTALYADSPAGVEVYLSTGFGRGGSAQGDTLISIENVWGSSYEDNLFGTETANELFGLDGNDFLYGGGGADLLDGGWGRDYLNGGAGADSLNGGPDIDTVDYWDSPTAVNVSLTTGLGFGGYAEGDRLVGVERVQGSDFDDVLLGDGAANDLSGSYGNDTLYGLGGADVLTGWEGRDQLFGGEGDDRLVGDDGLDTLHGGPGVDTLYGDLDADTFVWTFTDDTGTAPSTADHVADFNFAEGDRLYLGAIDADVYATGNQSFTFIGNAAFSGTPGEINYYHLNGNTYIQLQTGMSADVEGVIRIDGIVTPQAGWFVL